MNHAISDISRYRRFSRHHGLYRYNMLQSKGHWFPGTFATEDALAKVDASKAPPGMDVVGMLRETHQAL
jgi:predicted aldo/keto reductase-like oxidoreductase